MLNDMNRREFFKKSLITSAVAASTLSLEEKALLAAMRGQEKAPTGSIKGLPMGKIGNLKISRLITGGNLIGGYAHSRDLTYVSALLKHYFTDEKIFETLQLCEENGINTIITNTESVRVLNRYRNERGGEIQWLAQCVADTNDLGGDVKYAIDNGAAGAFLIGNISDNWARHGRVDLIGKVVDIIKSNGIIGGVGGHNLKVPMLCEEAGVNADFYMKTLHSDDYWSATPKAERPERGLPSHDNMWCTKPEETIEFFRGVSKPWIAFKILAAGAIQPQKGFKFAFENGADFANVGMFDFQVRQDAIITHDIIAEIKRTGRTRPWIE